MSDNQSQRSQLLEDPAFAIEAAKGDLIIAVTEAICSILDNENIERQDLAERIGKTKGYVSQLLNGSRNMTLATLAELSFALGHKPVIKLEAKGKRHEHGLL